MDHFLKRTVWYFLVKFLLMCAVSTHVLAKYKISNKKDTKKGETYSLKESEEVYCENDLQRSEDPTQIVSKQCLF